MSHGPEQKSAAAAPQAAEVVPADVGGADLEPLARGSAGSTEVACARESQRRERRKLIRAAVAAAPVVLTFTAGKARAQEGTADSAESENTDNELDAEEQQSMESDSEGGELSPSEKLETFGLQRAERPAGYADDPFRSLDSVGEQVDLSH